MTMPGHPRVAAGRGPYRSQKTKDDFPEQRGTVRMLLSQGVAVDQVSQRLSLPIDYVSRHSVDIAARRTMDRRQYWDDEVRSAVKLYVSLGPDPAYTEQRHYVYTKHIHPALTKMAELVVMTRSRGRFTNESKRSLIDQLVSDTYLKLDKYDITRDTNSFGYFNTAMGNFYTHLSEQQGVARKKRERKQRHLSLDDADVSRYLEQDAALLADDAVPDHVVLSRFVADTLASDLADVPDRHRDRVKAALSLLDADRIADAVGSPRMYRTYRRAARQEFRERVIGELKVSPMTYYAVFKEIQREFQRWSEKEERQ
jgi:hypothetical protein